MIIREKILELGAPDLPNAPRWLLFDIETTGLDRENTQVVLIGTVSGEQGTLRFRQYLCEHLSEEPRLLMEILRDIADSEVLISYNGDRFDIPYLNARLRSHGMHYRIPTHRSFDLYRYFKDNRRVYNLPDVKLKTVEKVLGIPREDDITGADSVRLYFNYLKRRDPKDLERILLHNHDDLVNLVRVCTRAMELDPAVTGYLPRMIRLSGQAAYFSRVDMTGERMVLTFAREQDLPPFHVVQPDFMIDTVSSHRILHLPILRFETQDGEWIFADPDRLFCRSFDGMDGKERARYLLMRDDRMDWPVLENLVNEKVDIE